MCSVERTKWPVRAASIEIFAVSASRISPTMTTSGSERRIDRSADANVSPARTLICTWLTPASRYSTGSSTVMTLISGRLMSARQPYSVVDLPEPVGPVTSSAPVGSWTISSSSRAHRVREPELQHRRRLAGLVEEAHDDLLALDGRERRDADVERAPDGGGRQRDPAVLRLPPLGDVELRQHLEARRSRRQPSSSGHAALPGERRRLGTERRARPPGARSGRPTRSPRRPGR